MSNRSAALRLYKHLHRTSQVVFQGDVRAVAAARNKIRDEFNKNRGVSSPAAIQELTKIGHEAAVVLQTQVIQAAATGEIGDDGRPIYRANIRQPEQLVTNAPFKDDISDEEYKASVRAHRKKQKEAKSALRNNTEPNPTSCS